MARRDPDREPFDANQLNQLNQAANQALTFARQYPLIAVIVLVVALIVGIVFLWNSQRQPPVTTGPSGPPASPDMLLGNPSGATPDPANRNNYLMVKPYFSLSYNDSAGEPNWVSWRVTASDLGSAPRKQVFDSDTTLPPGYYAVNERDYSRTGFDRGHMCPHSDRAANQELSYATFVMSNIIPQAPNVNRKAWAQLESYGRELVRRHNRTYVITGPAGRGGTGSEGGRQTIADGHVAVPAQCWKIIVEVPEAGGDDDLAKINAGTRVITVLMPNDNNAVGEEWSGFRTTPAAVERATGYHFFDRLPPATAEALRQKIDTDPIPPPRPMEH